MGSNVSRGEREGIRSEDMFPCPSDEDMTAVGTGGVPPITVGRGIDHAADRMLKKER